VQFASFVVFAGVLAIAAGSPGPSIAALVARVLARGWREVLPFLAAMWIGEAIWLAFAVGGLAAVAQAFQFVFTLIKYAGAAYLLLLAWKMWRAPVADAGVPLPPAAPAWRMFLAGLSVTLGNPKIMVFYMALLPTIIDLHVVSVRDWADLTLTMFAVLIVIDLAWALLAAQARRLLRSARAQRFANRVSGTIMGGAAVAIAVR
jgi:threonine/homoserine/homoserine lactone efflux protein